MLCDHALAACRVFGVMTLRRGGSGRITTRGRGGRGLSRNREATASGPFVARWKDEGAGQTRKSAPPILKRVSRAPCDGGFGGYESGGELGRICIRCNRGHAARERAE